LLSIFTCVLIIIEGRPLLFLGYEVKVKVDVTKIGKNTLNFLSR